MKNILKTLLSLAAVLLAAACSTTALAPPAAALPQSTLDMHRTWQLVSIQGRTLDPAKKAPVIVFNPDAGTASGFAYCNQYSFKCTLQAIGSQSDGDYYTLSLERWGSGYMECTVADMNAESRYLALLAKATRLRLTAYNLTLFQKNKEILYFELR